MHCKWCVGFVPRRCDSLWQVRPSGNRRSALQVFMSACFLAASCLHVPLPAGGADEVWLSRCCDWLSRSGVCVQVVEST